VIFRHIPPYSVIFRDIPGFHNALKKWRSCLYVCAYSSINYRIKHDLVPKNLEAVCIEIIKPQSQPFVVVTAYKPPNSSSEIFC
jgi:hypothetical protein